MADKPLDKTEPPKDVQQLAEQQAAELTRRLEREYNAARRKRIIILAILSFLALCTGKKPEDQKEGKDSKTPEDLNGSLVESAGSHVETLEAARTQQPIERIR